METSPFLSFIILFFTLLFFLSYRSNSRSNKSSVAHFLIIFRSRLILGVLVRLLGFVPVDLQPVVVFELLERLHLGLEAGFLEAVLDGLFDNSVSVSAGE